jgi:type VI secretion system protein ImpA
MAALELEALTAPVSDSDPCGPDLDLEGDLDYMNFMARVEGLLPASFFRDGRPFDRGSINFPAEFDAAAPFLEQSRDLRLLTLLARFHVLNRDLAGFETCVRAISTLLTERWNEVHPRGEDGDFTIRMAALETLDDTPTVVLPLQFIPLASSRRVGTITFRHYMIAQGEAQAPEGDDEQQPIDLGEIDRILMEAELEPLVATLRSFEAIRTALGGIRNTWIEQASFDQAPAIEKAPQLLGRIIALLQAVAVKRDPTLTPAEPAPGGDSIEAGAAPAAAPAVSVGSIKSAANAVDALAAIAEYFARNEPSSPALLLVRQAEQLVGKSFVEVMQLMLPAHVGQASIAIGGPLPFQLSVEALHATLQNASWSNGGGESPPADPPPADGAEAEPRQFRAGSRAEALALLDQVGSFYRSVEPSSPVAVIAERARRLAERDFMGLLQDFLPDSFKPPS